MRVRYAPSPTGELHLGSLRTVLFNWLVARQSHGTFIVRLEDTDQARVVAGSAERQLEAMRWVGIEPDEGVYLGDAGALAQKGEYGPYIQSERLAIYREHVDLLLKEGKAYRCFATADELDTMRKEQQARGEAPRYDRRFRDLPKAESDKRAAAGEPFVVRQALPLHETVDYVDEVRGLLSFASDDLDDHVLLKSDGFPTYQLASVVDDHLMQIDLVIRGEEWISSLPKNILLYQAFGWTPPKFAHVPVILGPDKAKLSKRHGAEPVLEYRERGYVPAALLNTIAFIGWSPGTEEEFFTPEELVRRFELRRVQKGSAIFNPERLEYVNGWYIRHMSVGDVASAILPFLQRAGIAAEAGNYLLAVTASIHERLKHFSEAPDLVRFFFGRPPAGDALRQLIVPKKGELASTQAVVSRLIEYLETIELEAWTIEVLEERLRLFISMGEYRTIDVLWPMRAALTGLAASPGAFEVAAILGKDESIARLRAVQ
jgi:glutamyl-tRNA synthetase